MADDPESSFTLLRRAQAGDKSALNELLGRYYPRLLKWASGRLPYALRTMRDTGDLVQESVIKALTKIESLELRTEGALIAYLRTCVNNAIVDEFRRRGRRPLVMEIPEDAPAAVTSPLDAAIGAEALEAYERALASLRAEEREAIVLRVEFGYAFEEIAVQMQKPSKDAARMAVSRAIAHLADVMGRAAA